MPHRLQEELLQFVVVGLVERAAHHHHQVAGFRQCLLVFPEDLPEDPASPVPLDCDSHPAGGDDADAAQALLLRRFY